MKKYDPIIIGIIVVTLLVIVSIVIAAGLSSGSLVAQYSVSDAAKPQLLINETDFDFGDTKLSDIKIKEIQIKNIGAKPLVISDAITSCDCTAVQFIIGGAGSPKFSMRRDLSWRGEIAAQETAIVRIIYQPSIMPVQGKVSRSIVFKTNDPVNSLISLSFTANVR